jgi:ATP synthase I chain
MAATPNTGDAMGDEAFYAAAERRIEYLTIGIGAAGAGTASIVWGIRAGIGVALGALLSWINFRWMKQGIGTLARLSTTQQDAPEVRIPKWAYLKFLGRYVLLIIAAYVILRGFRSTAASLLAGLFAAVAAVLVESIGQLFRRTSSGVSS